MRDTNLSRPRTYAEGYAIESEHLGSGRIGLLLKSGGPFAIVRLVVAVIVNSLKRSSIRALSHIGKEVFKPSPTFANFDAPASVSMEPRVIRIKASMPHPLPYMVFGGVSHFVRTCSAAARRFFPKTVTRSNHAVAAIAEAIPKCRSALGLRRRHDKQPAIPQPESVRFSAPHMALILLVLLPGCAEMTKPISGICAMLPIGQNEQGATFFRYQCKPDE